MQNWISFILFFVIIVHIASQIFINNHKSHNIMMEEKFSKSQNYLKKNYKELDEEF